MVARAALVWTIIGPYGNWGSPGMDHFWSIWWPERPWYGPLLILGQFYAKRFPSLMSSTFKQCSTKVSITNVMTLVVDDFTYELDRAKHKNEFEDYA